MAEEKLNQKNLDNKDGKSDFYKGGLREREFKVLSEKEMMDEGMYDGVFNETCGKIRSKFNLPEGDYDYHIWLEYRDKHGNLCHRNLYLREKGVSVFDENGFRYELNMYGNHLRTFKNRTTRERGDALLHSENVSVHQVLSEFDDFLKLPNDKYFIKKY